MVLLIKLHFLSHDSAKLGQHKNRSICPNNPFCRSFINISYMALFIWYNIQQRHIDVLL